MQTQVDTMTAPVSKPHIRLLPATRTGWASLAAPELSVVAFFAFRNLVDAGHGGLDPLLLVTMGCFFGFAFLGAIAGVVDLVRSREKSLVLILPVLYGLAWAAFLAGEFVSPH